MMKNNVVWITGGTKGIGFETAKLFAKNEAKVIVSGRNDMGISLDNIEFIECDVSEMKSVERAYKKIIEGYGRVDILVNNAGVLSYSPLHEIEENEFDRLMNINLKGQFLVSKVVLGDMIKNKSGKIVGIHSIVSFDTFANASLYSASKAASKKMMECLREEVRHFGIDVINIYPGATETDMWDKGSKSEREGRMMFAEDVALGIYNAVETSFNSRMIVEEIILRPKLGNL